MTDDKQQMTNKEKGDWGEEQAVHFLRANGFEIKERNWRYSRAEVDVIAFKTPFLVFVEVKLRKNADFGEPEAFVGEKKQELLTTAAIAYCDSFRYDGEIRFDVISILGEPGQDYQIQHLEDAFFPGL